MQSSSYSCKGGFWLEDRMYFHNPKIYLAYWSFPEQEKEMQRGKVETRGGIEGERSRKNERIRLIDGKRVSPHINHSTHLKKRNNSWVLLQYTDLNVQLKQYYSRVPAWLRLRYIMYAAAPRNFFKYLEFFLSETTFSCGPFKPRKWDCAVHKAVSQVSLCGKNLGFSSFWG